MRIVKTAQIDVPRPAEEVFDLVVAPEAFPRIFHGVGPIPGITKAEMLDGAAPGNGTKRRVHMTDGNALDELIVAFDRPNRCRYRWASRIAPPLCWLVSGAEAEWTFEPSGGSTSVRIVYNLELTTPLVYPLAAPVAAVFRRWLMGALSRIRAELA